jgi:hypothetical protein
MSSLILMPTLPSEIKFAIHVHHRGQNPFILRYYVVANILDIFGHASGLITNRDKCAVFPIHCESLDLEDILLPFQYAIQSFQCTYLGLPLHFRQPGRVQVQPIIDKMAARLPMWKRRFLNRAGRLTLLNSVLSSIPSYFMTIFPLKKWAVKKNGQDSERFPLEGVRDCEWGTLSSSVAEGDEA